jgi:hypothetical protein
VTEQIMDMGVEVRTAGGPEALQWTAFDTGSPGRGEVRIAQRHRRQLHRHVLPQRTTSRAEKTWRRAARICSPA